MLSADVCCCDAFECVLGWRKEDPVPDGGNMPVGRGGCDMMGGVRSFRKSMTLF